MGLPTSELPLVFLLKPDRGRNRDLLRQFAVGADSSGFGFDAQTLGHTIMCARECSPDQVVHETTHVPQQQQQDGVGSFIRDVWQWRFGLFGGGYCNIDYEK